MEGESLPISPEFWLLERSGYIVGGGRPQEATHVTDKGRMFVEKHLLTSASEMENSHLSQIDAFVAGAVWWEERQTGVTLSPGELVMAKAVAEERYSQAASRGEEQPNLF
jgi:hypothetical protein